MYTISDTPTVTPSTQLAAIPKIQDFLANGDKIQAIKLVRNEGCIGLKEAKDFVDGHLIGRTAADQDRELRQLFNLDFDLLLMYQRLLTQAQDVNNALWISDEVTSTEISEIALAMAHIQTLIFLGTQRQREIQWMADQEPVPVTWNVRPWFEPIN